MIKEVDVKLFIKNTETEFQLMKYSSWFLAWLTKVCNWTKMVAELKNRLPVVEMGQPLCIFIWKFREVGHQ